MFAGLYDILHCSQPDNYPIRSNNRYEGMEWVLAKVLQNCAKNKIPISDQLSTVQLVLLERGDLNNLEIVIDAFAEALMLNLQLLQKKVDYLQRKLESKTKSVDIANSHDSYEEAKTTRPASTPSVRGIGDMKLSTHNHHLYL